MTSIHDMLHDANPTSKDVKRSLQQAGFEPVRQTGSHLVMRRGSQTVVVPMHGDLQKGMLGKLRRQSGVQLNPKRVPPELAALAQRQAEQNALDHLRARERDVAERAYSVRKAGRGIVKDARGHIQNVVAWNGYDDYPREYPVKGKMLLVERAPDKTITSFVIRRDQDTPYWYHFEANRERRRTARGLTALWIQTGTSITSPEEAVARSYNPSPVNPAGLFLGIAVTATLVAIAYAVFSPPRVAEIKTGALVKTPPPPVAGAPPQACEATGRPVFRSQADGSCPVGTEKGESFVEAPPGSCVCFPILTSKPTGRTGR